MLEDAFLWGNDFAPYTLITVDAVSGLVATVEIPSGERWLDAGVRKCNEHKESCVRLGASSNMTFSRAYQIVRSEH